MVLVDTNVLIDVLQDDPQWADWSITQMRAQARVDRFAARNVWWSADLLVGRMAACDRALAHRTSACGLAGGGAGQLARCTGLE